MVEPELYDLYLFNDDKNTESYVIQTLIHVMDHTPGMAAKLTADTQRKGKVLIDTGEKDKLVEKRDLLISFGLSAQICKS